MDILGIITGLNSNVKPSDYMSTLSSNAVVINSSNTVVTKSNASASLPLSTQTILSPANAGLIKTNASQTILKPLNTAVSVSLQGMIPYHSCIPVGAMYNQNGGDFNVLTPVYLSTSIVGETSSEPQESTCIIN